MVSSGSGIYERNSRNAIDLDMIYALYRLLPWQADNAFPYYWPLAVWSKLEKKESCSPPLLIDHSHHLRHVLKCNLEAYWGLRAPHLFTIKRPNETPYIWCTIVCLKWWQTVNSRMVTIKCTSTNHHQPEVQRVLRSMHNDFSVTLISSLPLSSCLMVILAKLSHTSIYAQNMQSKAIQWGSETNYICRNQTFKRDAWAYFKRQVSTLGFLLRKGRHHTQTFWSMV